MKVLYQSLYNIIFLSLGGVLWYMLLVPSMTVAQVVHECDASITPQWFAKTVTDSIFPDKDKIFYTQNNLEKARKSFDTYCCRSGYLDVMTCYGENGKELYNDDLKITESPYLIEHLLRVVRMYVQWDKTECDRYDMDCEAYIEQEANYPWLWVCWRNGADEEWGDSLCSSVYDIPKGIDTILADTEPSVPWVISGLYKKIRISGNDVWIKPIPSLDERDPEAYTMTHLLYRTCDEVVWIIKQYALISDRPLNITNLDNSGTRDGKSEIWLCHTYMQQLVTQHANYAIAGSHHAAVYVLDTHRDGLMARAQELLTNMLDSTNKFVWAVTEVLNRKWDYAPQQCSTT